MRRLVLAGVTLVAAISFAHCATTQAPKTVTSQTTATIETGTGTQVVSMTRTVGIQTLQLQASLPQAWAALSGVYRELGLPVNSADSSQYLLGSVEQRLRRIGGRGMGSLFDCPGAYENMAASGDVYVSVQTQLAPDGAASQAHTTFVAYARGRNTGQKVPCQSLGQIESMFETRLQAALEPAAR